MITIDLWLIVALLLFAVIIGMVLGKVLISSKESKK
jgi:hypothetical protein